MSRNDKHIKNPSNPTKAMWSSITLDLTWVNKRTTVIYLDEFDDYFSSIAVDISECLLEHKSWTTVLQWTFYLGAFERLAHDILLMKLEEYIMCYSAALMRAAQHLCHPICLVDSSLIPREEGSSSGMSSVRFDAGIYHFYCLSMISKSSCGRLKLFHLHDSTISVCGKDIDAVGLPSEAAMSTAQRPSDHLTSNDFLNADVSVHHREINMIELQFSDDQEITNEAGNLSQVLASMGIDVYIPIRRLLTSEGVIDNVGPSITLEDIINTADSRNKIIDAQQLNKRILNVEEVTYQQSKYWLITFEGRNILEMIENISYLEALKLVPKSYSPGLYPSSQVFEGPFHTPQMYPPISSQRDTQSAEDAQIVSVHNRKMLQRNSTETSISFSA
ncbi:hypothetical protein WA026_012697 [Henosepilachna vigintioctopunctata]|uniref:Uncharacterized protein n=1 Tax=Henosepilachna vigintioctopunctata TaxID=420089 RepID=A0AAW1TXR9_9CUCU